MSNLIANLRSVLSFTEDVITDIVTFAVTQSNLASLKDAIKARITNEIAESGADRKAAIKDLKAQVKAALVEAYLADGKNEKQAKAESERRASEAFVALGLRERAEKSESKSKKEKDEKLAPVIEKLIALAEAEAGEDAVSALRRAWLSKQAKSQS
jgi:hypothetical protein